jgi:hypothetical protein
MLTEYASLRLYYKGQALYQDVAISYLRDRKAFFAQHTDPATFYFPLDDFSKQDLETRCFEEILDIESTEDCLRYSLYMKPDDKPN